MYFSCFGNLEHDITKDVEAESLGRHVHAVSSPEKSGMKPLKEAVEQADEDQAVMAEWDDPEEEPTEDEAEDPESEGKKTVAAVAGSIFPCCFSVD